MLYPTEREGGRMLLDNLIKEWAKNIPIRRNRRKIDIEKGSVREQNIFTRIERRLRVENKREGGNKLVSVAEAMHFPPSLYYCFAVYPWQG